MDTMIAQAVRAAGSMQPHFQRNLATYLRDVVQPQLDRLAELETGGDATQAFLAQLEARGVRIKRKGHAA